MLYFKAMMQLHGVQICLKFDLQRTFAVDVSCLLV